MKAKWFNRKNILLSGVVILVIGVATLIGMNRLASPPAAPSIATVRRGDLRASVNATGKVRAQKAARLALPLGGVVQSIEKREGDAVKPGEVILALRAEELGRRVRQAELNLASRQLELERAKAAPRDEDIEIARANVRRATLALASAEEAYNKNPTPQNEAAREYARIDLDVARANFDRVIRGPTQAELTALENAVAYAQLDLENARNALAQMRVTAPFTGTVIEINIHEGELTSGYNPLAVIADLSQLEIVADIDEIDVANVAVGQSVEVRLDAFPGELFQGTITRLFPAATTQRGTTVYTAIVDFDPKAFHVRLGMGANLKIFTVEKKNVLLVPNRALKNVGTRKAVHLVAPGEPRDVFVEVGVTNGIETEIISGVQEGDQVNLP